MSDFPPSLTMPTFPPSLHSLFLEDQPCHLTTVSHHEHHHHHLDPHRRRLYGNINTQINSSRLPLSSSHIATQIRSPPCRDTTVQEDIAPPRSLRQWTSYAATRPPTPPPRHIAPPLRIPRRRSADTIPDTRRHGMVLYDAPLSPEDEDEEEGTTIEDLPAYTPPTFFRMNTTTHHHHNRRRGTRRATFPLVAQPVSHPAFDFEVEEPPPPYALSDPHPYAVLDAGPRRPGLVARVLLPFKGERVLGRVRRGLRMKGGY